MKLGMALIALAWPGIAWAQSETPVQDRQFEDERASPFEDSLDQADRERGFLRASEPEARVAIQTLGKCVAERKPAEAHRVLVQDFTASDYEAGLRALSRGAVRSCVNRAIGGAGSLRSAELLFAGSLAEALLERDSVPLNVRLARNSGGEVASFSPSDSVAQCLARSLPDQVAALFATTPGSEAEENAAAPLLQTAPICARAAGIAAGLDVSVAGLRAIVATAAYRLVSSFEDAHA